MKSNPEEPYPDQAALPGAVTINDLVRCIRKSLHSVFGRGMRILPSCQSLTLVLRAAITEEMRDSTQKESYLPFPWGHTQAGKRKIIAQCMVVSNIVKKCDIELIIHTF